MRNLIYWLNILLLVAFNFWMVWEMKDNIIVPALVAVVVDFVWWRVFEYDPEQEAEIEEYDHDQVLDSNYTGLK